MHPNGHDTLFQRVLQKCHLDGNAGLGGANADPRLSSALWYLPEDTMRTLINSQSNTNTSHCNAKAMRSDMATGGWK